MFHPTKPFLVFLLFVPLFLLMPKPALAASFSVNSTLDTVDANPGNGTCADSGGKCTLRAAVQEATALGGTNTITVPAGTYKLTIAPSGSDDITTGDLNITTNLTITGASATTTIIDGNQLDDVFYVYSNSGITVSLSNLTVQNGNATLNQTGGGIALIGNNDNVTLTNVIVQNNTDPGVGSEGGGMDNYSFLTMTNVSLINNSTGGYGGGIANNNTITGTNVTISGNTANDGGGVGFGTNLTLTNSTIANNTATSRGGGIGDDAGNSVLTNVTIVGNTAPSGQGAGIQMNNSGHTITIKNTIVANNSVENCHLAAGTIVSTGHNLSSDSSCSSSFTGSGDLNGTNPKLSALASNGGFTQTMALQAGSPAIDAGTNSGCPATDQVGTTRPQDGLGTGTAVCDIGAFEYINPNPPSSSSTGTNSNSSSSGPNSHPGWANTVDAGPNFVGPALPIGSITSGQVIIPSTASHDDLHVSVSSPSLGSLLAGDSQTVGLTFSPSVIPVPWSQGFNIASEVINIYAVSAFNGFPESQTDQPFIVTIAYNPDRLFGYDPENLQIAFFNPAGNRWQLLTTPNVVNLFSTPFPTLPASSPSLPSSIQTARIV